MTAPYLAISVNDQDGLKFSHIKDGSANHLEVDMALSGLEDSGYDEACRTIGSVVLSLMEKWYPNDLAKYPKLKTPYHTRLDLDLIGALIAKSVAGKTTAYVSAIDLLIADLVKADPQSANQQEVAVWPDIKDQLEKRTAWGQCRQTDTG